MLRDRLSGAQETSGPGSLCLQICRCCKQAPCLGRRRVACVLQGTVFMCHNALTTIHALHVCLYASAYHCSLAEANPPSAQQLQTTLKQARTAFVGAVQSAPPVIKRMDWYERFVSSMQPLVGQQGSSNSTSGVDDTCPSTCLNLRLVTRKCIASGQAGAHCPGSWPAESCKILVCTATWSCKLRLILQCMLGNRSGSSTPVCGMIAVLHL